LKEFDAKYFSKQLALGEPQLAMRFFDIEILDSYFNNPRFDFKINDYSGSISCKYDEYYNTLVRKEDDLYIKSFGIGYDEYGKRVAVVCLRYLNNLSEEQQSYWKNREVIGKCKVLEAYYINLVEGRWYFPNSLFSLFLGEQKCLNDLSEEIFKIKLFRETFENEKRPKEFTFFFIPTTKTTTTLFTY